MSGPLHTGTHWQSIALHHFIKLLVYLFVLLLSARCEREGLLRVGAFRIPVLFLVQSLRLGPGQDREKETERGNEVRTARERRILTPYRLKRISSSSLFRNLSSCRGLWSIESSPSGSGLLQPLKPFFRNVLNSSKQDREETHEGIMNKSRDVNVYCYIWCVMSGVIGWFGFNTMTFCNCKV